MTEWVSMPGLAKMPPIQEDLHACTMCGYCVPVCPAYQEAAWESASNAVGNGGDRDILFVKSSDNGVSWSVPAALNVNAATDAGDAAHWHG